jgi:hypothetical protein
MRNIESTTLISGDIIKIGHKWIRFGTWNEFIRPRFKTCEICFKSHPRSSHCLKWVKFLDWLGKYTTSTNIFIHPVVMFHFVTLRKRPAPHNKSESFGSLYVKALQTTRRWYCLAFTAPFWQPYENICNPQILLQLCLSIWFGLLCSGNQYVFSPPV